MVPGEYSQNEKTETMSLPTVFLDNLNVDCNVEHSRSALCTCRISLDRLFLQEFCLPVPIIFAFKFRLNF